MIEFMSYMIDLVRRLLSLWADERLSPYFGGVSFLYIILSIWIMWSIVNMFLIRPMAGGSLFGSIPKETKEISTTNNYLIVGDNHEYEHWRPGTGIAPHVDGYIGDGKDGA